MNNVTPQSTIRRMPSDKGVEHVCQMLSAGYLAEKSGKKQSVISSGIKHTLVHGMPYYFRQADIDIFQRVIEETAMMLLQTEVVSVPTTYGLASGASYVEKILNLRTVLKLPYLFQTLMGRTVRWQYGRLSDKDSSVYGKFEDVDIMELNDAIRTVALDLLSIRLEYIEL